MDWLVTANGAPVAATVTAMSSVLTPPPPVRLSRTVSRKFMVRATVGITSDQQACAAPMVVVSAGQGPGTLVLPALIVDSFGRKRTAEVLGTKDRKSGPADISGLSSARWAPRSRCSQLYVRVSPLASVPAPRSRNGVDAGITPLAPASAVGTVLPVGDAPRSPGLPPVVWAMISSKLIEWK